MTYASSGSGGEHEWTRPPGDAAGDCDWIPFRPVESETPVEARRTQVAVDEVEEASMESFPCSDPPAFIAAHA